MGQDQKITLIFGSGVNTHYELGLVGGLRHNNMQVDVVGPCIGSDKDKKSVSGARFVDVFRQWTAKDNFLTKVASVLNGYLKILSYTLSTDSKVFHIQWHNKFELFDRTVLVAFYKLMGKRLLFTAHNIDRSERDLPSSSFVNRMTLKFMYNMVDHIIVHTDIMKTQLADKFQVPESKVSVVPHGIMDSVERKGLSREESASILGLEAQDKYMLFFGFINPYKGLDMAVLALKKTSDQARHAKLIIAGQVKKGSEAYWQKVESLIEEHGLSERVIIRTGFVRDEEIEAYFSLADVLLLPYQNIFQSGALFLALQMGMPVIATDVGSLGTEIRAGNLGFVSRPQDPDDLAGCMDRYYESPIYLSLEQERDRIIQYGEDNFSWRKIGSLTQDVYGRFF